jgi:hypothetical protein
MARIKTSRRVALVFGDPFRDGSTYIGTVIRNIRGPKDRKPVDTKRKIEHHGMMCWKNGRIFTSKTLCGEYVGLEEIDDGIWLVYYGPVLLALR